MSDFRRILPATAALLVTLAALLLLALDAPGAAFPRPALLAAAALGALTALILLWRAERRLAGALRRAAAAAGALAGDGDDARPRPAHGDVDRVIEALARARRRLESSTASRQRLERLLASMNEAIIATDEHGRIERANAAAHTMLDAAEGSLLGTPIARWMVGDERRASGAPSRLSAPIEGRFRRGDGSTVCVSYTVSEIRSGEDEPRAFVYAAQNVDHRKRVEQRIRYLARTDPLTRMANRMQFQHLLQQAAARAKRTDNYLALLYLDVDRFKDINDTFGHAAGDTSLEIFARRLRHALPEAAVPGRLAGDEFAVALGEFATVQDATRTAARLAGRIIETVGAPFRLQDEEIYMTASVGIALYPRDADNAVDLLRNADAALYQAKKAGGNCFEFHSADLKNAAEERLTLKSKLRLAFEREELRLHYQPKYGLASGRIEGAEALVRWNLPDRGLVFPSDFIPIAEETNFILQIGDWVLNRVCMDYRRWQRVIPSPPRVSVNLSLRQLQQQRFLENVRATFRAHSVPPACLELEITETTLMEDIDRTVRMLDALHAMGLHLAIDDFGTGYSSLSALQQFPISTLKIDQSFVRDLGARRDAYTIVKTIVQMALSLGLEVVAEGVESERQLELLRELGCHYAQGHLFGDPVSGDEFCALLLADAEGTGRHRALFA